jgi:hypothetical protein
MGNFNSDHKLILDELLLAHPEIRPGNMFGYPAYYAGKKVCISLYEQGVTAKLPEQDAARLLETDPNVIPFQPMGGRKMREWIQINLERSEDYRNYEEVFQESIRYVLATQEKRK